MRVCVVGGGLAGSLLAWRLCGYPATRVTLVTGDPMARDATVASGGLIRAFDPDPGNAELAGLSLAEMRASTVLRDWAGYREVGSLYLTRAAPSDKAQSHEVLSGIERRLPGSVSLLDTAALAARFGFREPAADHAILERHAGFFSPDRLRRRARADVRVRGGNLVATGVTRLRPSVGECWSCETSLGAITADVLVVAAGAWSGQLLRANGLPAGQLRTKVIQYARYRAPGLRLPPFVDEVSGLYGRPSGPGAMLFGLPTQRWDATADHAVTSGAEERAVRDAARRLTGLALAEPTQVISAVDAYAPDSRLTLRPVDAAPGRLFTFTGGSGGSAKTALAASASAATHLLDRLVRPPERVWP